MRKASSVTDRINARIVHHNKAKVDSAQLAKRYLALQDYPEAARWADAARGHRAVVEVLQQIIGGDGG